MELREGSLALAHAQQRCRQESVDRRGHAVAACVVDGRLAERQIEIGTDEDRAGAAAGSGSAKGAQRRDR